jgi:hypothetical protein
VVFIVSMTEGKVTAEPEGERAGAHGASDPILDDVLHAPTEELRQEAIAELLSAHVYRRVDQVLAGRFRRSSIRADQREDVRAEILLKLVNRLRRLVSHPDGEPLQSFADYVSVVAFNTFDDFVRRAYPLRTKLKNRIRYALRSDARFALWDSGGAQLCGFRGCAGEAAAARVPAEQMSITPGADVRENLADLFAQAGGPIELDAVVSRIAAADIPVREESQAIGDSSATIARGPGQELEDLQSLRELWNEICALPLNQRIALLLSARDSTGESVTQFLPVTGVATIRQIGATLSIDAHEFGDLWHELPLEDTRIAVILSLTRQQVINLRRSARDRLARRLKAPGTKRRTRS